MATTFYSFDDMKNEYDTYEKEGKDETEKKFQEFNEQYSIEVLKKTKNMDLIKKLFGKKQNNHQGLFSWIEHGKKPTNCRCGDVAGGQLGILFDEDRSIITMYEYEEKKRKPEYRVLSEDTAIKYAITIVEALSKSCEIISKSSFTNEDDYIKAYKDICDELALLSRPKNAHWYWTKNGEPCRLFFKYFFCSFPQYFAPTYTPDRLRQVLIKIIPESKIATLPFVQNGQISLYSRKLGADCINFESFINQKGFYEKDQSSSKTPTNFSVDTSDEGDTNFSVAEMISKNTILYGPPGTGKTYNTAIYAVAICEENGDLRKVKSLAETDYNKVYDRYQKLVEKGRVLFTTFHQSYGYEDFIEGIKPTISGGGIVYKLKPGVFKKFCDSCAEYDSENKVFIIDEINRGNISKIFGELITLIEDDKRGEVSVTLPYSGNPFTVPKNVYILGTMNTADRSIALMDTALRRRFTFVEMMPNPEVFTKNGNDVVIDGVNIRRLLEEMNTCIEYLYDREHTIGHAYFKEFIDGNGSISDLRATFKNKIIPLLQEYFYDDYEKIRLILGDNTDESASLNFIKEVKCPFGSEYDEGYKYDINPEIWSETVNFADRLKAIYEKNQKNHTEETGK